MVQCIYPLLCVLYIHSLCEKYCSKVRKGGAAAPIAPLSTRSALKFIRPWSRSTLRGCIVNVRRKHIYKEKKVLNTLRGSLPVSFNYDAFSTISFTTIVSFVDRDETRPKQVFSSSPLTLKNWELSLN